MYKNPGINPVIYPVHDIIIYNNKKDAHCGNHDLDISSLVKPNIRGLLMLFVC